MLSPKTNKRKLILYYYEFLVFESFDDSFTFDLLWLALCFRILLKYVHKKSTKLNILWEYLSSSFLVRSLVSAWIRLNALVTSANFLSKNQIRFKPSFWALFPSHLDTTEVGLQAIPIKGSVFNKFLPTIEISV